ncbi:MAG: hypothetical protein ABIU54_12975 [Candidatus Eisenbacteria bacterium]
MSGRVPPAGTTRALAALTRLEALRHEFGSATLAREKRASLTRLARAKLPSAADVLRLHELLVFMRAYPDSEGIRSLTERLLRGFAHRRDLGAHRAALADSGIAGTDIHFRFFAETARWLAGRHPMQLCYDWDEWEDVTRLEEMLPLLAVHGETPGLDEYDLGLRGWLDRMRGDVGDAAWATTRLAARVEDPLLFERLHDGIDAPMKLASAPGTPSRTLGRWPGGRIAAQRTPLRRERPELREELARPPRSVMALSVIEGQRMVDLARETMVTRSRDLDAFAYADPRDVRWVDCGDGLALACMGVQPERRLLLESVYGMLTLKNGVPIGYVLTSALFGSAEIAYNVFDTFRGAEAGAVYGRVLSTTRFLFGVDSFTIYPYQLGGAGNHEGLASGAWWFYRKLGFEPRARSARTQMHREETRMARDPAHRSSPRTLAMLGEHNVYWHLGEVREDVIGSLPLANLGLAITDLLAKRFARDGNRGAATCIAEARERLGGGPTVNWSPQERQAFERWAPLVLLLRGMGRWTPADRRALVAVIRAKGGARESDFVRRFDAHARLRSALTALATDFRA